MGMTAPLTKLLCRLSRKMISSATSSASPLRPSAPGSPVPKSSVVPLASSIPLIMGVEMIPLRPPAKSVYGVVRPPHSVHSRCNCIDPDGPRAFFLGQRPRHPNDRMFARHIRPVILDAHDTRDAGRVDDRSPVATSGADVHVRQLRA